MCREIVNENCSELNSSSSHKSMHLSHCDRDRISPTPFWRNKTRYSYIEDGEDRVVFPVVGGVRTSRSLVVSPNSGFLCVAVIADEQINLFDLFELSLYTTLCCNRPGLLPKLWLAICLLSLDCPTTT